MAVKFVSLWCLLKMKSQKLMATIGSECFAFRILRYSESELFGKPIMAYEDEIDGLIGGA